MDSKDLKILAIVAVLAVVVIAAFMVSTGNESPNTPEDEEPNTPIEPVPPVETVDDGIFLNYKGEPQLIVDDSPSGSRYASEGMTYYVMSYALKNSTDSKINVYRSDFVLTVNNLTYSASGVKYSDSSYSLAKGDTHTGYLTFLIPENADSIVLSYKDAKVDEDLQLGDIPTRSAGQIYGKVTYKASNSYGFINSNGNWETPKSGSKFIIVSYTLENISYEDTITANALYLELEVGGVMFSHDWATFNHPDYLQLPKVAAGNSVSTVLVFEVNSSVSIDDVVLKWTGSPARGITVEKL